MCWSFSFISPNEEGRIFSLGLFRTEFGLRALPCYLKISGKRWRLLVVKNGEGSRKCRQRYYVAPDKTTVARKRNGART